MNFATDSTLTNPDSIVGLHTGSTYIVPAEDAGGDWSGHEDRVAVYGGAYWNFLDPLPGTEYQIVDGPDNGKIFVRTPTPLPTTNLVPDGTLFNDVSGYPEWSLSHTGSASTTWSPPGFIYLNCTAGPSKSARATVVIPTIAGVKYNVSYDLDALSVDGTTQFGRLEVRELPSNNIITDPAVSMTGTFSFVAVTNSTSLAFYLYNTSEATTASSMTVDSLTVTREKEHIKNGDFSADWANWTPEFPWFAPIETGLNGASIIIDFSGHTPLPALRQTLTGMVAGRTYRVAFDVAANFPNGFLTVRADSLPIGDVSSNGRHAFYFRAGSSSVVLEFPVTDLGSSNFELLLSNVNVAEAIWIAGPVCKANLADSHSGLTCGRRIGRQGSAAMPAVPSLAVGSKRDRQSGIVVMPANDNLTCGSSKGTVRIVQAIKMPAVANLTCGAARVKFLNARVPAIIGGVSCSMEPLGRVLVRDAVRRIMNLWGHTECCSSACSNAAVAEALGKLNAAMQRLYATGKDFGFVSTVPLSLTKASALSDRMPLPDNVVAVKRVTFRAAANVGATVFAEFPLRPVVNRHEHEAFRASHIKDAWPLDSAWSGLKPYVIPLAYFAEAEDTGIVGGVPALAVMTAPQFTGPWDWSLEMQVTVRPPAYRCTDVEAGTVLSVPHNYAETLLLPLALYYACSSRYFVRPELVDAITKQAQEAREFVGEIQPAPAEATKKGGDR